MGSVSSANTLAHSLNGYRTKESYRFYFLIERKKREKNFSSMCVCVAHDVFIPLQRILFAHNFKSFSIAFYSICTQFVEEQQRSVFISIMNCIRKWIVKQHGYFCSASKCLHLSIYKWIVGIWMNLINSVNYMSTNSFMYRTLECLFPHKK